MYEQSYLGQIISQVVIESEPVEVLYPAYHEISGLNYEICVLLVGC